MSPGGYWGRAFLAQRTAGAKALRSGLGLFQDQQGGHGTKAEVTWRRQGDKTV